VPRDSAADDPFQRLTVEQAEVVLRDLVDRLNGAYLEVGALLSRIEDECGLDEDGFKDYVKQELRVGYRKARYLISIHRALAPLGAGADQLRGLGWAKAKEIARVPVEHLARDLDALVQFALKYKRYELIDHINARYGVSRGG